MWRLLPLALLASSSLSAQDWAISGFGSLGYSYDDSDDVGNIRSANQYQSDLDEGSWKHSSNAALQLDYFFSEQWSATAQALYEPSNHYHDAIDYLNLGFIQYNPNQKWSLKAGRFAPNIYIASDSRNIDFAHLWAYPVKEVYGFQGFNSIDGVSATRYWETDQFLYSLTLQYGNGKFYYPRNSSSHVEVTADNAWLTNFRVSHGNWNHNIAVAIVKDVSAGWDDQTQHEIDALEAIKDAPNTPENIRVDAQNYLNNFQLDENTTHYYFIGSQYFDGEWLFQVELNKLESESGLTPIGYGGYAMLGRTFGNLTPYGIVSTFIPKDGPVETTSVWGADGSDLQLYNEMAALNSNVNRVDQTTLSLGVRYDIATNIALKFQFDAVNIEDYGYGLWYADPRSMQKGQTIHVYTASLNYVF
ncbi:hypothetical protein [Vibrio maerlii]|uniref:hypothetical protein n=1 Tax=Vibrio maerlii TaxID=2231648 RepID=UPI000E3BDFA2|nr:hypothetical protein [Vibrio maerlii]